MDALSGLFTTRKNESLLKEELPLLSIDLVVNANTSDTFDNCKDYHIVNVDNTKVSENKLTCDSPTFVELIRIQKNKVFCRTANVQVNRANNEFSINSNRLIAPRSVVDGVVQIVVKPSPLQHMPMESHHPTIARHPGP